MKCQTCGEEHELLEPAFGRPDVIFAMSAEEKKNRVFENNDLCALRGVDGTPDRYFVRCILPVRLLDSEDTAGWGLWVEVSESDCEVIWKKWTDPDQDRLPPMSAALANQIPNQPVTIGLPVRLKLTGAKSRPQISFSNDSLHPFAKECLAGVSTHRVVEWLHGMR
jgi:hypothetical protein